MNKKTHMKSRGEFNERYDAFFNREKDIWLGEKDIWLGEKCNDPNCEFCKDRPNKPSEVKE